MKALLIAALTFFASCSAAAVTETKNVTEDASAKSSNVPRQDSLEVLKTLDVVTFNLVKSLASNAPVFSPILTFSVVSYVAYVALVMGMPSTLKSIGLPLLDDIPKSRSAKQSADHMDILTALLLKEVATRSKVADELLAMGRNVVDNGISVVKAITDTMHEHANNARDVLGRIVKAVRPECLARTLCEIGQMTRENFPFVIFLLRTIDSPDLDGFSQALIDGTTIGDCSSVYYECDDL